MENKTLKTHLNYGLLAGVVLVVLFIVYYVFGLFSHPEVGFIPAVVLIVFIIVAQINHAKALQGDITYGNLWAMGFKTTAVATCIFVLFLIIFILLVSGYRDMMMNLTTQYMLKRGLNQDQVSKALANYKRTFMVTSIGSSLILYLIIGSIGALIGAAIPKKNPKPNLERL
jgi:hypothetical protein